VLLRPVDHRVRSVTRSRRHPRRTRPAIVMPCRSDHTVGRCHHRCPQQRRNDFPPTRRDLSGAATMASRAARLGGECALRTSGWKLRSTGPSPSDLSFQHSGRCRNTDRCRCPAGDGRRYVGRLGRHVASRLIEGCRRDPNSDGVIDLPSPARSWGRVRPGGDGTTDR
jgi:hypothetical protein